MPAKVPHQDLWDKPGAFTLLILDPSRVAQVAQHSVDPARVEIVPRFAMWDALIQQIATALETELTLGGSGIDLYPDTLAAALSAHLVRNHSSLARLHEGPSLTREQMRRAADFMRDNFHRNLKLADIAAMVHMSEYHFARTFKQVTGVAPHQFLIARRIEHAQGLLRTTALSVDEVAHRVGFSNQSHFTAHFSKVIGATPKRYRLGC
jgi:AraC family transcriptional regulator